MSEIMNAHIRHLQERVVKAEKRISELEAKIARLTAGAAAVPKAGILADLRNGRAD